VHGERTRLGLDSEEEEHEVLQTAEDRVVYLVKVGPDHVEESTVVDHDSVRICRQEWRTWWSCSNTRPVSDDTVVNRDDGDSRSCCQEECLVCVFYR
jgi:hypothetical protein